MRVGSHRRPRWGERLERVSELWESISDVEGDDIDSAEAAECLEIQDLNNITDDFRK